MSSNRQALDDSLRGRRILIVEDEWLIALELQELLELHGCTVLGPVNSVARALALLDEHPDAALLDLNLNGQRSTVVSSALSAQQVPFLVVTGYGEAAAREMELGAAAFVAKPVDHRQLVGLLTKMVSEKQNGGRTTRLSSSGS